jgi:hypothetical protein
VLLVLLVSLGIGQEQICPPDVATAFTGDQVAINQLTVMAVSGNARAQACLGLVYRSAEGVPKDAGQAVFWFRKSAEQGHVAGQTFLGESYYYGNGVPKDAGQAVFWYRKAAAQGYAAGQYSLGLMFDTGVGVPKDAAQAVFWCRKAAEQGDTDAQSNLGASFAIGVGVPKDLVIAFRTVDLSDPYTDVDGFNVYGGGKLGIYSFWPPIPGTLTGINGALTQPNPGSIQQFEFYDYSNTSGSRNYPELGNEWLTSPRASLYINAFNDPMVQNDLYLNVAVNPGLNSAYSNALLSYAQSETGQGSFSSCNVPPQVTDD